MEKPAGSMTFSVYPEERAAILQIMRVQNLKSTFDVIRLMARQAPVANPNDFRPPKKRR